MQELPPLMGDHMTDAMSVRVSKTRNVHSKESLRLRHTACRAWHSRSSSLLINPPYKKESRTLFPEAQYLHQL